MLYSALTLMCRSIEDKSKAELPRIRHTNRECPSLTQTGHCLLTLVEAHLLHQGHRSPLLSQVLEAPQLLVDQQTIAHNRNFSKCVDHPKRLKSPQKIQIGLWTKMSYLKMTIEPQNDCVLFPNHIST